MSRGHKLDDFLDHLRFLAQNKPEHRIGQIIYNCLKFDPEFRTTARGMPCSDCGIGFDLYNVSDDDLVRILNYYVQQFGERLVHC